MTKKQQRELLIGMVCVLIAIGALLYLIAFFPYVGDFVRTTLAPIATVVIGFFVLAMALYNYQQKTTSEFVVNYTVSKDRNSPGWDIYQGERDNPFARRDRSAFHMPYIAEIYIRNEKDKLEVIQKIYLQLNKKILLPLAIFNKPLLLKPFSHTEETLDPVTYYTIEDDPEDNSYLQGKHYVVDEETGRDMLLDKKNKIIIQTEEGWHLVKPNITPRKLIIKKSTTLASFIERHTEEAVLPYHIKYIYSVQIENTPPDEEFEKASVTKLQRKTLKQ